MVSKNYQKTSSRSSSKTTKTTTNTVYIQQTAYRLVLNPFDTTGSAHQEIYIAATGNK